MTPSLPPPSPTTKYCKKTRRSPRFTPEPSSCTDKHCSLWAPNFASQRNGRMRLSISPRSEPNPRTPLLPLAGPSRKLHGNPQKATNPRKYQHRRTGTATTRKDPALSPPPPLPPHASPLFVDPIKPQKLWQRGGSAPIVTRRGHHTLQALVYSMFPASRCASSLRLAPTQLRPATNSDPHPSRKRSLLLLLLLQPPPLPLPLLLLLLLLILLLLMLLKPTTSFRLASLLS